jgi:hypothetical protein
MIDTAEAYADLSLLQKTASQEPSYEQHSAVDRRELKERRSVRNVARLAQRLAITLKMSRDWSKYITEATPTNSFTRGSHLDLE